MTWFDVVAPLTVIGLFVLLFFVIVTSEGVSRGARRGRKCFPHTARHRGHTDAGRRRWSSFTLLRASIAASVKRADARPGGMSQRAP